MKAVPDKVAGRKKGLLFVNKKKQKNFDLLRAVALPQPTSRSGKSFLLLFVHKKKFLLVS
jgi:hypothetical protein